MTPTSAPPGDLWPTPLQELLLRAALCKDRTAVGAWNEWQACVDIDTLDTGSGRLLPLLWRNLETHGVKDPRMERYKSVSRYHWVKNQLLMARAARLIERLETAGIPTLVLKGAALSKLYYPDDVTRPMDDFDVLVPTEQATEAFAFLLNQGYRLHHWGTLPGRHLEALAMFHAVAFRELGEANCDHFDIHRNVLGRSCAPGDNDAFWAASVPFQIGGIATRALCPEDALLHVCVHGMVWNEVPPLRWIADAVLILRATPDFDWTRLIAQSRHHGVVFPLLQAMRYLDRLDIGASVPAPAMREFSEQPISRAQAREWQACSRPPETHSIDLKFWLRARIYGRWNARHPLWQRPFMLPTYFRSYLLRRKHLRI